MASSSSSNDIRAAKNTIKLRSSDGHTFELEKAVAIQSPKLNKIIAQDCPDQVIQIPSATTNTLSQVVEFLKKHAAARAPPSSLAVHGGGGGGGGGGDEEEEEELKLWDDEFVKDVEGKKGLLDLTAAANFLEIKSLLELLCRAVADVIDGKSPEEIRNIFDIKEEDDDVYVPPEAENEMRDFDWAYT